MTKEIAGYLGKQAATMLEATPFKVWPVEKSFEEDLKEFHYVFKQHGLELRCDSSGKIGVIFMRSGARDGFDESLFDIPFFWERRQVLEHLGAPAKSGGRTCDPILGDYGAWDRFVMPGHAIHVEYRTDSDSIKLITLMRDDMIP